MKGKNATPDELEKIQAHAGDKNQFWWATYVLATTKKDKAPEQSCQEFQKLSVEKDFPLQDLALLRAYEVCQDTTHLSPLPTNVPQWYRELFINIKLNEAIKTADINNQIAAYKDKARLESNKKKKEEFYLKALELAQKAKLDEEIIKINEPLFKNSPRLMPEPVLADFSNVALDYRFHRDFDKALQSYKKIIAAKETSPNEYFQALKNIRQTYKVAQRRQEYIEASGDLVAWAKKQFLNSKKDRRAMTWFHDAQILNARTLWTEDQTSKAVEALNETQALLKDLYPLDEVYFVLGKIAEEKKDSTKALEYFQASFDQPVSQVGLREKIAWHKSWNYYKQSKWTEAKDSLLEMQKIAKDPTDKAKARFWLARSLSQLGLKTESENELQILAKEDPLGYYGMLAVRELNQIFAPIKSDNNQLEKLSLLDITEAEAKTRLTTEWLIAVNEKNFAEKSLNTLVEELKKKNVSSEKTWLTVASGYARTGLYLPLFSILSSMQTEVKDQLLKNHPDLLFPQEFADIIFQASQKSGIASEFIFSIIRQESAFNPEARSGADAFGLMQLLPSVAKKLSQQNGVTGFNEDQDLFKPEVNIPLGAFELKNLMHKYSQQFILAVSGYNANDGAIRGWIKTRFRADPVEFIEEVPYEETRTYIKLVMRNYVFYQRLLNAEKSTNTPLQFPEALLSLGKISTGG